MLDRETFELCVANPLPTVTKHTSILLRGRGIPRSPDIHELNGHLIRLRSDSDDLIVAQVVVAVEQARRPVLRLKVRLELIEVDRVVLIRY